MNDDYQKDLLLISPDAKSITTNILFHYAAINVGKCSIERYCLASLLVNKYWDMSVGNSSENVRDPRIIAICIIRNHANAYFKSSPGVGKACLTALVHILKDEFRSYNRNYPSMVSKVISDTSDVIKFLSDDEAVKYSSPHWFPRK